MTFNEKGSVQLHVMRYHKSNSYDDIYILWNHTVR